jgi:hypothetical protein
VRTDTTRPAYRTSTRQSALGACSQTDAPVASACGAAQVYLRAHASLRDDMADWAAAVAALLAASPDAPRQLLLLLAGEDEAGAGAAGPPGREPAAVAPPAAFPGHLLHSFLVKCDAARAASHRARLGLD